MAPRLAVIAEQIVEIGRGLAEAARQAVARAEGGAGRADIGVGGAQALLGAEHIPPASPPIGPPRPADPLIDLPDTRHPRRTTLRTRATAQHPYRVARLGVLAAQSSNPPLPLGT